MPLTPNCAARPWFASTSTLTSSICPARSATSPSRTGASAWQGPHHSAQKSTTTGSSRERSSTASSKVCSVTSIAAGQRSRSRPCRGRSGTAARRDVGAAAGDERCAEVLRRDAIERPVVEVDLDLAPRLETERASAVRAADRPQRVRVEHAAPAVLTPCDPLELAELLERVDPDVRVRCRCRAGSRGGARGSPGESRRRGRPRSSGRRRSSSRCLARGRAPRRWRASRGRSSSAAPGSPPRRAARSAACRARRGTPRSRAAARRRGRGGRAPRRRRSGRARRASRAGRRGRSGGRSRPRFRGSRSRSTSPRYAATEGCRIRSSPPRA